MNQLLITSESNNAYASSEKIDLFDEAQNRIYYTVDEFAGKLRTSINTLYSYEMIKITDMQ